MEKMNYLLPHQRQRLMKQSEKKFLFRKPKPRNLEARELYTPKYSLKVIPDKSKKVFRKRKHKGQADEED